MKISLAKTKIYDLKDFVAKVYVDKGEETSYNAIFVECRKRHYKTKLNGATRLYFVVSGKGYFTVNNKKESTEPYDLFVIKDGDIYEYEGRMRLIEVNVPATDKENEEKLE